MAGQFLIHVADRFPGQATSLSSHITTVNKIVKKKLTPTQLALFRKTVFGRFVDMEVIFNSPLVHYILLMEVKEERRDVMTFDLHGTIVSFTKEDFLLVTGLWRTPGSVGVRMVECELEDSVLKYYKKSMKNGIHINTLDEEYQNMEFQNDTDAVKMTLVYYTELAMMGREKTRAHVDMNLFLDVENIDYFNSVNWGNVLWEMMFPGLKKGLLGKADFYKKRSKMNKRYIIKYNLPGFPHAFQLWAYEIISTVAMKCATLLNKKAIPRFLRWECKPIASRCV